MGFIGDRRLKKNGLDAVGTVTYAEPLHTNPESAIDWDCSDEMMRSDEALGGGAIAEAIGAVIADPGKVTPESIEAMNEAIRKAAEDYTPD